MKILSILLVGILFCFDLAIAQDVLREWNDVTGKHKTRATLVKLHKDEVELRLENGETRLVPKSRLSLADVAYLDGLTSPQTNTPAQPDKFITNSIGMKLLLIDKGTFQMGASKNEEVRRTLARSLLPLSPILHLMGEGTGHKVTISQDYYLGVYEVRQAQFKRVMGKNPSYFQGDRIAEFHPLTGKVTKKVDSSHLPVENVTWEEAVEFCQRLSELPEEKKAGRVYRLPTEAEWEYACRARNKSSVGKSETSLGDYAWYNRNSSFRTHRVGSKKPNAWGLYDMLGNVDEWCSDWYGEYPKSTVTDPVGPSEGVVHVQRGGNSNSFADSCGSTFRSGGRTSGGFRVALSAPGLPKKSELDK